MATTKTKKTTTSSNVHKYVSTSPANKLPEYNKVTYDSRYYNKGMPSQYKATTYNAADYNKGMPGQYQAQTVNANPYATPDAYKADTYTADRYNGPGYTANKYNSNYQLGNYTSKYMPDIEQRVNSLANWQYDPLQDASYQALASVYGARGNLAAKNTLADAAALNGGYGTSYATSAAQQARNQYNQELASMIPQLEQAAYNRAQTGLSALMDIDQTQYGRYRDTEADKQWLEQNRQNVHQMNQDDLYRAAQFGLDVFNTNTANKQWAAGMNQSEKAKAYDSLWDQYNALNSNYQWATGVNLDEARNAYNSLWDIYNTTNANNQWTAGMNQAEKQAAYDSLWDIYNTKNANRQYVSGMNQGERQFAYNAGMDAAQLANDYYQWATGLNNSLYEWNLAQEEKAKSGGGGGGGGRKRSGGGGGGGGYVEAESVPSTNEELYNKATETVNKKKGKAKATASGGGLLHNKQMTR